MNKKEINNFLKKHLKEEKSLLYEALFFVLSGSLLGLTFGFLTGKAIESVTFQLFDHAFFYFILYLIFGLIDEIFLSRMGEIKLNKISNNIMEKISYETFCKVGLLPARAFEEKTSGELINRIVYDSASITDALKQLIYIIISLISTTFIFIYIIFNNLIVALEIIIYLLIFKHISNKYLKEIKIKQKEIQIENDKVVAEVSETIRGIREIKALGIRKKINKNIKNIIKNIYFKTNQQMITEKNYNALIYSINYIFETIVFLTCVLMILFKTTSLAFFISMTYYIYRFMGIVDRIMNFQTTYQKMNVAIERIDEIINNKLFQDETFGKISISNIKGNIEFKNVTFKYFNEDNNIFNNLNFYIEENKLIAIVGKSGQGKTSIFNLLLRYFNPNEGEILIDNVNINDFDEDSLRKNISIIRQEPFLFNKTILDNLRIIDENLELERIKKVCQLAEIDDYIMSLPKKYDTLIGEGGVNLSGGQKQRLAIARALLKESKIILFDEATSALDNENQEKIKKVMHNLSKDHTIIVVAHRLSTIIDADEIFVIEKGQIIDKGNHKQLMKKSQVYKNLYQKEVSNKM